MTATTRMQSDLGAAEADTHGSIIKKTVHLEGVDVTEVTFGVGARWSKDLLRRLVNHRG